MNLLQTAILTISLANAQDHNSGPTVVERLEVIGRLAEFRRSGQLALSNSVRSKLTRFELNADKRDLICTFGDRLPFYGTPAKFETEVQVNAELERLKARVGDMFEQQRWSTGRITNKQGRIEPFVNLRCFELAEEKPTGNYVSVTLDLAENVVHSVLVSAGLQPDPTPPSPISALRKREVLDALGTDYLITGTDWRWVPEYMGDPTRNQSRLPNERGTFVVRASIIRIQRSSKSEEYIFNRAGDLIMVELMPWASAFPTRLIINNGS
jgi:hypothetical protein